MEIVSGQLAPDCYALLDFGRQRKLERFGSYLVDRPAPAAGERTPATADLWKSADLRYERKRPGSGRWRYAGRMSRRGGVPGEWLLHCGSLSFELRATCSGQVGIFVEQVPNWEWIVAQVRQAARRLTVLNLFGYTGGSTLAAAAAGARVVHVDAARNVVAWARRNAGRTGLSQAPIRWITEDAVKFVRRELRRGRHYDAVILDPPTYGHGPKGEVWQIGRDLAELLMLVGQLTQPQRAFLLLTCHAAGFGPPELEALFADAIFGHCQSGARAQPLWITAQDGRRLPCGVAARWPT